MLMGKTGIKLVTSLFAVECSTADIHPQDGK